MCDTLVSYDVCTGLPARLLDCLPALFLLCHYTLYTVHILLYGETRAGSLVLEGFYKHYGIYQRWILTCANCEWDFAWLHGNDKINMTPTWHAEFKLVIENNISHIIAGTPSPGKALLRSGRVWSGLVFLVLLRNVPHVSKCKIDILINSLYSSQ